MGYVAGVTRCLGSAAVAVVLAGAPVALAAPAQAAVERGGVTVTGGCTGTATSTDRDAKPLGSLDTAAGVGASRSAPFLVDRSGTVNYRAGSPSAITDNTWSVKIAGITVDSGAAANATRRTSKEETVDLADYLPVSLTGTVLVEASVTGQGGSCTGETWIKLTGNPFTSANGLGGTLLLVAGLAGAVPARPRLVPAPAGSAGVPRRRRRPFLGLVAGLLVGLGASLLLTSASIVPLGVLWVALVVVIGLLLGVTFGVLGPVKGVAGGAGTGSAAPSGAGTDPA
ncbi:MAG: hypothetical protein GXX79_02875 [Actinomycetales bacterium]|nr:hypothetical protein [Actinomycetales bacterium]